MVLVRCDRGPQIDCFYENSLQNRLDVSFVCVPTENVKSAC